MIDKISEYTSNLKELAKGLTKGVNNVMNGRDFMITLSEQLINKYSYSMIMETLSLKLMIN